MGYVQAYFQIHSSKYERMAAHKHPLCQCLKPTRNITDSSEEITSQRRGPKQIDNKLRNVYNQQQQ